MNDVDIFLGSSPVYHIDNRIEVRVRANITDAEIEQRSL